MRKMIHSRVQGGDLKGLEPRGKKRTGPIKHQKENYLSPAPGITSDDSYVLELAQTLTEGTQNDRERVVRLFEFVRDHIRYNLNAPFHKLAHYEAQNTLRRKEGFCIQKSSLLVTLARSIGIPSRLVFADIRNHLLPDHLIQFMGTDIVTYHCYVEWFLKDDWIKVAPSFDEKTCRENGFRLVIFDGYHDAVLPSEDLYGQPHITYLKQHGVYNGIPIEEILEAWKRFYGQKILEDWKNLSNGMAR